MTWYEDGVRQMSDSTYVPAVASLQDFYLILSADTHGKKHPYTMYVSGIRAFTAPVPEPATWGLLAMGILALLLYGRRLRRGSSLRANA